MFNCILPISTHTQRFGLTVSFRRKILTLRQLYPRVPSQPSVLPCRMGRTSTSTTLMTQLVQTTIPSPHVVLENIYIIDQNFCSLLNQITFSFSTILVRYVLLIYRKNQYISESKGIRSSFGKDCLYKLLMMPQCLKGLNLICFKVINFSLIPSSSKIEVCLNITHATPLQRYLV